VVPNHGRRGFTHAGLNELHRYLQVPSSVPPLARRRDREEARRRPQACCTLHHTIVYTTAMVHRRYRWRSSPAIQERARQLRREATPAERRLWQHLRGAQLAAYEFRRQYPMGRFIVDFYCPQAKLVIELDGDTHADQTTYDAERSHWIDEQKRCTVIRFTNSDVHENLAGVLDTIATVLRAHVA